MRHIHYSYWRDTYSTRYAYVLHYPEALYAVVARRGPTWPHVKMRKLGFHIFSTIVDNPRQGGV